VYLTNSVFRIFVFETLIGRGLQSFLSQGLAGVFGCFSVYRSVFGCKAV